MTIIKKYRIIFVENHEYGKIYMIITFIGHGKIDITADLQEKIKNTITENIFPATTFYCGGYGNFDNACAKIVHQLKAIYPHIQSYYVTPYIDAPQLEVAKTVGWYDGIIYPPLENIPLRLAIVKRNEYMIDKADLIISFVTHSWGGAATALAYATKKKKRVISLI